MNPAESTNLIQLAALGLVGVATVILANAQKIQMQIAVNVENLTVGVNAFREEVRDLRTEVRELREITEEMNLDV